METTNIWRSSAGLLVYIYPYFECGVGLVSLEMHEEIAGNIATGKVQLISDGSGTASQCLTDSKYISISVQNEKGRSLNITNAVVTNASHDHLNWSISFICSPTDSWWKNNLDITNTNRLRMQ